MMNKETVFYVSPDGNDTWSGCFTEPNAARNDGPLRTLEAAQAVVRRHKGGMKEPGEIRIFIRSGTYELTQPWLFTAQDSGFPSAVPQLAQTWPVVWAAYPGEKPVISGGTRINNKWWQEIVNGREVWVTEIPEVAAGRWNFRQLWVNGQRRNRPCLPKQGMRQVERAFDADYNGFYLNAGSSRFGFKAGELSAAWRNLHDIELQFFGWWVAPRVWLDAVDETERIAWFDRNSMMRLAWGLGDGVDYRVENVFDALGDSGEWYLDRPAGKLYYIPVPGEDMTTAEIVAPRLETLLRIDGAANLGFEGLTFAHNEWCQPGHFADSIQASYEVPGAVILDRADNCEFRNCRILHTNTYGVEMEHDTVGATLEFCELRDLGAGGVKIWHGCRRNAVVDCEIADGGHFFPAGVGVLIGRSTGNRIVHNHIHNFFYSGISVGWNWGYGESDGYGNIIEWNHIHDIGKGLLSDMGGIYLLGHAAGTRLRYNHVHDVTCRRYGGWCIYTDEGSSDVLIESNLCYNADKELFHQHYGRNNQIRNNIFAYGGDAVLAYGKPEPHLGLVFESNIFLSRNTPILRGAGIGRWTPQQTVFRNNLYWCEAGPVTFNFGGNCIFASQPFPNGFKAEASRFASLNDVPTVNGTPDKADWIRAFSINKFVTQFGAAEMPAGTAELLFLLRGDILHVRGVFKRPAWHESLNGAVWNREHLEIYLKPFADRPGMMQIGLASDGEAAIVWHDCDSPGGYNCFAETVESNDNWQATLQIPLSAIIVAAGGTGTPSWSFFVGLNMLPEIGDWVGWQAQGHDPAGVVADPLFADAKNGDFHLCQNSPALSLGFVPFDYTQAGRGNP